MNRPINLPPLQKTLLKLPNLHLALITEFANNAIIRDRQEGEAQASNNDPSKVSVNAKALHELLMALNGHGHQIRELQLTRGLGPLTDGNPIDTLISEFNAQMRARKAKG